MKSLTSGKRLFRKVLPVSESYIVDTSDWLIAALLIKFHA